MAYFVVTIPGDDEIVVQSQPYMGGIGVKYVDDQGKGTPLVWVDGFHFDHSIDPSPATVYIHMGHDEPQSVLKLKPEPHEHEWGPVEYAHITGNPHRKCACGFVSLDLTDDDDDYESEE